MLGYPARRKSPSFSSSLLDSIYRSIDEPECNEQVAVYRTKIQVVDHDEEVVPSLRRAIMIEKWMEGGGSNNNKITNKHTFKHSNSSDSSCCATIFSSSDNESATRSRQKSPFVETLMQTPKRELKFITTTKSRALQIFSDLKKVKQPISPGARITSLLNSIFSSKTIKKSKLNEDLGSVTKSRSLRETTNSSASTTCLRKSPSSRCKMNSNGMKRAVRFSPVSVNITDCNNVVYKDDPTIVSIPILKNLDKKNYNAANYRGILHDKNDDEDDIASCSSSDLFELDNIGEVGMGVYAAGELPVYGTTNLPKTNNTMANAYVL